GNLARLMALARTPWPLPLGLCGNRRSLLARQNLIAAVHFALGTLAAKNQTYIVADPEPLSLAEIIAALRAGTGRAPSLLPAPPAVTSLGAHAIGRGEEWQRLGGNQVAAPAKLLADGWQPTVETRAGLRALGALSP